jgi:hypothetical protein
MKKENSVSKVFEKFVIRFPLGIRSELQKIAEDNRRSMNSEIIIAVEKALKKHNSKEEVCQDSQTHI